MTSDIMQACRAGDAAKVRELLAQDPTCVNYHDCWYNSPLHFASTPEVAVILLEHGADPSWANDDSSGCMGEMPAHEHHVMGRHDVAEAIMAYVRGKKEPDEEERAETRWHEEDQRLAGRSINAAPIMHCGPGWHKNVNRL